MEENTNDTKQDKQKQDDKVLANFFLPKDLVVQMKMYKRKTGRSLSHIAETGIRKEITLDKEL